MISAALASCEARPAETVIELGSATYRVPASHIRSATDEPHQFVRISPPGKDFDLVYDSRTSGRRDIRGWPLMFSINERSGSDVERPEGQPLEILCRRAVNPEGGCGMTVRHGGAAWLVLFPASKFGAAPSINREALVLLSEYGGHPEPS